MEAALGRLLGVPAPKLRGLVRKLELAFAHEIEPHADHEACLAAILGDARRLTDGGPAADHFAMGGADEVAARLAAF